MKLYCGIDLHSNNSLVSIINESDEIVFEKRFPNDGDDSQGFAVRRAGRAQRNPPNRWISLRSIHSTTTFLAMTG